ncbi:MAG: hypothetical protein GQ574_02780 [Crocinitomix sp.]|nr:hypothetical protein [Crocinitomix sp.]
MRKYLSLVFLTVLFLFTACDKTTCEPIEASCDFNTDLGTAESVLPESQLNEYYDIWKAILMEKSGMSETYFNAHITDYRLSSHAWNAGTSFRIDYIMTIDWIEIKCHDQFLVNMDGSYDAYSHLNIERNVFFNAEQIEFNIANDVHSTVNYFNTIETLKYDNCTEVYTAVNGTENTNILFDYVSYYVPGKLPRSDGDPYIILTGRVCNSENDCWSGYINLVTGEKEVYKTACVIVG